MIPGVDIEMLRIRAGFASTDNTHDADLEAAADQALALCETYCDRRFPLQEDTEEIWQPYGGCFVVRRYPLESITTLEDVNGNTLDASIYRVGKEAGIILGLGHRGPSGVWPLTITYTGGYDPLPSDLLFAVMSTFDSVWTTTPGWGAVAGSTGQQMQKISVVGVGSIDFSSGSGGDRFAADIAPWGALPVAVTAVLSRYKKHTVIGGG